MVAKIASETHPEAQRQQGQSTQGHSGHWYNDRKYQENKKLRK